MTCQRLVNVLYVATNFYTYKDLYDVSSVASDAELVYNGRIH